MANTLKIAVVGAGFSGTALTAVLHKLSQQPIEIILLDRTENFGVGDAYRTPFPFHLLNVRAKDMSAFEDDPAHFVHWLEATKPHVNVDETQAIAEQFVPRRLYRDYLKSLLTHIQSEGARIKLTLLPYAVVDAAHQKDQVELSLSNQQKIIVDKVVLSIGGNPANKLPFPVSDDVHCITNPWDYTAPQQIEKHAPVLIIGTGLSMIDAVLTLYHQNHQGKIYAVSRHGLLPLRHAINHTHGETFSGPFPQELRALTKYMREQSKLHVEQGGDWRTLVTSLRNEIHMIWQAMNLPDKKRFLRHVLPYWNIHRHRVHWVLADLLAELEDEDQLKIFAGRIERVENGMANIRLRHSHELFQVAVKHVINCMGPALSMSTKDQPLIHSLAQQGIAQFDPLKLGFAVDKNGALKLANNKTSINFYALGQYRRGNLWEISAVPEIRKQVFDLARHLLDIA